MSWMSDDICWCMSDCDNASCFRHLSNRKSKVRYFTAAYLKDTEDCPSYRKDEENGSGERGLSDCGSNPADN